MPIMFFFLFIFVAFHLIIICMKVKNLNFGVRSGECDIRQYCNPYDVVSFKKLMIEKRSSRFYYLYALQFGHECPMLYCRVSSNDEVSDIINDVLSLL